LFGRRNQTEIASISTLRGVHNFGELSAFSFGIGSPVSAFCEGMKPVAAQ
jgi:hypothetical protein